MSLLSLMLSFSSAVVTSPLCNRCIICRHILALSFLAQVCLSVNLSKLYVDLLGNLSPCIVTDVSFDPGILFLQLKTVENQVNQ